MRFLEIVELRTTPVEKDEVDQRINDWLVKQKLNAVNHGIRTYKRARVDTDLHIQIYHESDVIKADFSASGIELAEMLKQYGLVNHHIWIEMDSKV